MKIILATHNKHKRDELASMLGAYVTVEVLPENFPEIEETGTTLQENARIKAKVVFDSFHVPTLADDTGLEVEALNGAPGVYTARYAGEHATYADNCSKLLSTLETQANRNAVFKTELCFIDSEGIEHLFQGTVSGEISDSERGKNGFGYDPIFIPMEANGLTFAEMTNDKKNAISHRGRAISSFVHWLNSNGNGTQ